MAKLNHRTLAAWLRDLGDLYGLNKDYLTDLDAAIGDADHGINMARGFGMLQRALAENEPEDGGALCTLACSTLIKHVGGASGPLYGTLFMKMASHMPSPDASAGEIPLETLVGAFTQGVEGIKKMGRSEAGEKTMLDAWIPAVQALRAAAERGASPIEAFTEAAQAAKQGMLDTVPMTATKGRASFLGERSVGHQDPGATSTHLMLNALAETIARS